MKDKPTQEETVELTDEQRKELKQLIAEESKKTPFYFGTFGTVKHVELKGAHMRIFLELNPNYYKLDKIKNDVDVIKRDLYACLLNLDDSFDPFFKKLVANKVGLRIELSSYDVESILEIFITPEELKTVSETSRKQINAKEVLKRHIQAFNLSLPVEIDHKIKMRNIEIKQNFLVFNYEVDEVIGNEMNRMRAAKQVMGNKLLKSLQDSKAHTIQIIMDLCKRSNLGISYRYTGAHSGQQVTIYMYEDEINKVSSDSIASDSLYMKSDLNEFPIY